MWRCDVLHSHALRNSFLCVLLFYRKVSRNYSLCIGKPLSAENMFFVLEYFFSTSQMQGYVDRYYCWNWILQCSINAENMKKQGTRLLLLLLLYYHYMFTCVRVTFHTEHIKCGKTDLSKSFKYVRSLARNFGYSDNLPTCSSLTIKDANTYEKYATITSSVPFIVSMKRPMGRPLLWSYIDCTNLLF
jgi:hypothetical protein